MRTARLVAATGSASALLLTLPAPAQAGDPDGERALALLLDASRAARVRTWAGTERVEAWTGGTSRSALVDVRSSPSGAVAALRSGQPGVATVPSALLDERVVRLLAARHRLQVAAATTCAGRAALLVEARDAAGRVAGRFWLDRDTGLLLRREVYDGSGAPLRSAAFLDVQVGGPAPRRQLERAAERPPLHAGASRSGVAATGPAELGRYALYDAHREGDVVHLAYSDGLTALSLFRQPGRAQDAGPGWVVRHVDDVPVQVQEGTPSRWVWQGGGEVFVLLSDAPETDLRAVVRALPHEDEPAESLWTRLARGLARVLSSLDPR